ncbi:3-hydroxyacyl-CoA dehydrogenase family protein [Bacillus sp. JJ722]|uniref:3-hydroxyacyl-CoA dehydrogenase family protein n=1 Tax=Bacillus sp. JJ722 TaxID=3122973 RepID=UPI002FFDC6DA
MYLNQIDIPYPSFVMNREGIIIHVNEQLKQKTTKPFVGKPVRELFEEWEVSSNGRMAKGKLANESCIFLRNKWNEDYDLYVGTFSQEVEYILGEVRELRKANQRLDAIIESSFDGIYITDQDGITTKTNSAIERITGIPKEYYIGHFFNPVLVMDLVEVVKGPHTSDETAETSMAFVQSIGKTGVLLKKEISGFIANRILAKLMDEAVFLYENGYASFEEIDLVVTKALRHPIGPFALMDLPGLDVNYFVRMQRFEESGDENEKPSVTVASKVQKGELGRKTGKGFYEYDANGNRISITV